MGLLVVGVGVRWTKTTLATSGGDPYSVPPVVNTSSDPNIVETTITAQFATVDVGNGVMANVETYNGMVPGPQFRLSVGQTVIVHFVNQIDKPTGIHWHGIEYDNDSDGTPLTQNQVPPGKTFLYKFKVRRPGIFWYHPHHHSSTNQIFKGLYGTIVVTDPNEVPLIKKGIIPSESLTRTLALSDVTVCKASGSNDTATYDPSLPWVGGGALPVQAPPTPKDICETSPLDEDGNARGAFAAEDVPNIQSNIAGRENEGQTVLTNGKNVGGRGGSPSAPGALATGASTLPVFAGQGLRLRIGNAAAIRFFRLRLTDNSGVQIPLVRIGGQGGILDNAVVEGGVVGGFDTHYDSGEILLGPGDRADVVVVIPHTATGVLTLWTEDFSRTGQGFADLPTVPVAHLQVKGKFPWMYSILAGTPLRAATGQLVEALGAPTGTLLDPSTFSPAKPGLASQDIKLNNQPLGVDGIKGTHDSPTGDYRDTPHMGSARYAKLLDILELTVTNKTGSYHPFHLHGFSHQALDLTKSGSPTYTWPYNEFRDNTLVPPGYTLRFRVRLDERPLIDGITPGGGLGRWMFHCHIFFHATNGMLSEFDVVDQNGNEKPYVNADDTSVSVSAGQMASMTGSYKDPDGDTVTLTASLGTVTDIGGGKWSWNYTTNPGDSQFVYITATDAGGHVDQAAFELKVN
jgi:FtsP/CotA-like multicopper oxidase with cupredoxin domain